MEKKFGATKPEERFKELAKPKDRWKRGRILMQLKKKFPHDMVLEKMIKEEFKENRVFKYPEEYDLYDDEEDRLCKYRGGKTGLEVKISVQESPSEKSSRYSMIRSCTTSTRRSKSRDALRETLMPLWLIKLLNT